MPVFALHHVQIAMPEGGEDAARAFHGGLTGLSEARKPPILAIRGGVWFEKGSLRVHLGGEQDFRPARKTHPAFEVSGVEGFLSFLEAEGAGVARDENLPVFVRGYLDDPFGNRIELLEPVPAG